MDTKLTLKLDAKVIQQAKEYASAQQRSLSSIVEAYLKSLTSQPKSDSDSSEVEISPFVKSMASGVKIPSKVDAKATYYEHLMEKYQ
ncbi:DUF6364 family protein [Tunicatimonas pelagia]|uniref:DUF6364 family protein n=1 Tax=Tunicatimonas pelagia TaxID=931531 RepID=UPI002664E9D5|nr:DUF6364 family protein [Tunicatimonas pelagia]WKN41282.1 DUF6364 family protein [Tunicatimonas pelagia]